MTRAPQATMRVDLAVIFGSRKGPVQVHGTVLRNKGEYVMKTRSFLFRLSVLAAPLITALAIGGPSAQAAIPDMAGGTVVVATSLAPSDCGKYHTAQFTDLSLAVVGKTSGTILVCPGIYGPLAAEIDVANASKLTIKQVLTTTGSHPYLLIGPGAGAGLVAINSTNLTIDGLIFDLSGSAGANGIVFTGVSGAIRNVTIVGSTATQYGIKVDNTGLAKPRNVIVANSRVVGYTNTGVHIQGKTKLIMTGSLLDGSDGGRVAGGSNGVLIEGKTPDNPNATGVISKNTIRNNTIGVDIREASKVTVSKNTLNAATLGIAIEANGLYHNADSNKITGNTIAGIGPFGIGIMVFNSNPANSTMLKTTISSNVISAATFTMNSGTGPQGINVSANAGFPNRTTVSISKNTIFGFTILPIPRFIIYNPSNATVTVGKNEHTP